MPMAFFSDQVRCAGMHRSICGVSAAHVLFIDDRDDNITGAREAGLHAVQFLIDSGSHHLANTLRHFGIEVG